MTLIIIVSLLAVGAFAFTLWRLKIFKEANAIIAAAMSGVESLLDRQLDDDAKEAALRLGGFRLIGGGLGLAWRLALALAAAAAPVFISDWMGLVSSTDVFALVMRVDFIVIVSIAAICIARLVRSRFSPDTESSTEDNYQQYRAADRFFHAVAFSTPAVLKSVSWLEDRTTTLTFQSSVDNPIFVTSLARGGTTALLNALNDAPEIATHLYRDMPFLTAPLIWSKISGGNKRAVQRRKRAHGDGLEIDLDTPEAFEEVLWLMFWAEKYRGKTIDLWHVNDRNSEAELFIRRHMSKIISARRRSHGATSGLPNRYCSKNNANIARLDLLPKIFPGCKIVVPIRRPESHAASLLRQHQNFSSIQAEDQFVQRYMRDIGHFEFGQNHQPISFPGFQPETYAQESSNYWLHYWIQAFKHVRMHADNCIFVTQDALRQSPRETLLNLSSQLSISADQLEFNTYFRSSADHAPDLSFSKPLLEEATDLYKELTAISDHQKNLSHSIYSHRKSGALFA